MPFAVSFIHVAISLWLLFVGCWHGPDGRLPVPQKTGPQATSAAAFPHFEDIAQQAGLTVSHISSPAARYIIESVSGGVGLIDCDNDGKLDIITVNGSTVDRYRQQGGDPLITLYHQGADLKFS